MTVAELIKELGKFEPNLLVEVDCDGDATEIISVDLERFGSVSRVMLLVSDWL